MADTSAQELATLSTLHRLRDEAINSARQALASAQRLDDARAELEAGLAEVALSGDYASLENAPAIPSAPGDIGAATSEQGALAETAVQPDGLAPVATTGRYSDLIEAPVIGESGV
ncbi:MAG: hypothetical protein AAFW98_15725 [Pseudomonadota bacterium]